MTGRLGAWEHTDLGSGGGSGWMCYIGGATRPVITREGGKIYKNYLILVKQVSHIQQVNVVFHRGGQSKLWRG